MHDIVAHEFDGTPRIHAVGGQQEDARPGRDRVAVPPGPVEAARARGERREHGADGRSRKVVGDLDDQGRCPASSGERRCEPPEQIVGIAIGAAVQTHHRTQRGP